MDIQKTPSWRSEDIRVVGLGGDPKIPARTSDGAWPGRLTGQLDRVIELGANTVDMSLCVLHAVAVRPPVRLVRHGQLPLRVLQIRTENVGVVQPRGRTHRLRVGLQQRYSVLVQLVELTHHLDHGRDVSVVLRGSLQLVDLTTQFDRQEDLHLGVAVTPQQPGDDAQQDDRDDQGHFGDDVHNRSF